MGGRNTIRKLVLRLKGNWMRGGAVCLVVAPSLYAYGRYAFSLSLENSVHQSFVLQSVPLVFWRDACSVLPRYRAAQLWKRKGIDRGK